MNRRTFLKLAGLGSVAFASGCSPESPKHLYSLVQAPDHMVSGKATWYASTCRECPAGCGLIAKNREGRVVKLEGNPLHPLNRGKLCMRGQAALQAIYNPDRLRAPLLRQKDGFTAIGFEQARALLKAKAWEAARKGPDRVRMLTETVGNSQMKLFRTALRNWNSQGPVVFEAYAYEALKTANRQVFGVDGLVSYRMDQADVLLSFGAEFLETWLSPIEYAWKFKAMHATRGVEKGVYFLVSPLQTLTGANADYWLSCAPGSEAVVALGLVRQMLDIHRGKHLSPALHQALLKATDAYPQEAVLKLSGIPLEAYERLVVRLAEAKQPLVLGSGSGVSDENGLRTNLAANLLNLILDPNLKLIDAAHRHHVETAGRRSDLLDLLKALSGGAADLLILNNVNPVFCLPPESGVGGTLEVSVPGCIPAQSTSYHKLLVHIQSGTVGIEHLDHRRPPSNMDRSDTGIGGDFTFRAARSLGCDNSGYLSVSRSSFLYRLMAPKGELLSGRSAYQEFSKQALVAQLIFIHQGAGTSPLDVSCESPVAGIKSH